MSCFGNILDWTQVSSSSIWVLRRLLGFLDFSHVANLEVGIWTHRLLWEPYNNIAALSDEVKEGRVFRGPVTEFY